MFDAWVDLWSGDRYRYWFGVGAGWWYYDWWVKGFGGFDVASWYWPDGWCDVV